MLDEQEVACTRGRYNLPEPRYLQVDFPLLLRYKVTVFQFHQP